MTPTFDPRRIVAVLAEDGVECVLIGGLAGILHGSTATTNDADICPSTDPRNLDRLATALRSLHAGIRAVGVDGPLPFDCSATFFETIQQMDLTTDAGDLDLAFRPTGTFGYDDLIRCAVRYDIDGHEVMVASLDDVIASKAAADRPKDRAVLPILLALRDVIEGQA